MIQHDHYGGFEGEPELRFLRTMPNGEELESVRLWGGYLDEIMRVVQPDSSSGKWQGLAAIYHLDQGWCERSPWRMEDVAAAARHWSDLDITKLRPETRKVFDLVGKLLSEAATKGQVVTVFSE